MPVVTRHKIWLDHGEYQAMQDQLGAYRAANKKLREEMGKLIDRHDAELAKLKQEHASELDRALGQAEIARHTAELHRRAHATLHNRVQEALNGCA